MSTAEYPWEDECDACGHERWNHGEDEALCGFGGVCDCKRFLDEESEAALVHWRDLIEPDDPNRLSSD